MKLSESSYQNSKLQVLLQGIKLNRLGREEYIWIHDRTNGFTVKSYYKELNSSANQNDLRGNLNEAIVDLWTNVQYKIQCLMETFTGTFAHSDELSKRGILHKGQPNSGGGKLLSYQES